MPVKYVAGTFEGKPHYRWTKMHGGTRYRVKCSDLGLPEHLWTKEGSREAANAWWKAKLGELTTADPVTAAFKRLVEAKPVEELMKDVERGAQARRILASLPLQENVEPDEVDDFIGVGPLEDERRIELLGKIGEKMGAPVSERTIGVQLARYLAVKKDKAEKGVIKIGTYGALFERLHGIFLPWAGERTSLDSINSEWLDSWYTFCAGKVAEQDNDESRGWSSDYAAGVFGNAKSFVRWLWEERIIADLPRTFDKRGAYKFERPEPIKKQFKTDEITTLLAKATGQLKLHLLLFLNCGMTQADISNLRQTQIVISKKTGRGYIVRRRSKTERKKKTPIVRYLLWEITLKELIKWRSTDPTYALLNKNSEKWVRESIRVDGRKSKADGIKSNFKHLQRRTGIKKSLKVFRKTSATRLNNSKFERLVFLFLGHRAPDIARKNYAATLMKRLSAAIRWLGKSYGLQ